MMMMFLIWAVKNTWHNACKERLGGDVYCYSIQHSAWQKSLNSGPVGFTSRGCHRVIYLFIICERVRVVYWYSIHGNLYTAVDTPAEAA